VPHLEKQDGMASTHGSRRRGGWRWHDIGAAGKGFGGDSLSRSTRRVEADRQVGRNSVWAHTTVLQREAPEWVGSMDWAGLVADPAHEGIDYSFS
jgi:hypothetical protein